MSAQKCGSVIPAEFTPTVVEKEEIDLVTGRAADTLKRIRIRLPDFYPETEVEIWTKARSMGLMDEQD